MLASFGLSEGGSKKSAVALASAVINETKQVAKQNKHCVLNVGIHSIDRLHSVDLFPIVIFVKFP